MGRGTNSEGCGSSMRPPERPAIFRRGWSRILPSASAKTSLGYSKLLMTNQRESESCEEEALGLRVKPSESWQEIWPPTSIFLSWSRDQVGYFLSPFDFLKQLLTFFRFKAAFRRFVFPLFLIGTSDSTWDHGRVTPQALHR